MKKVININFHGRVVPIEETAYDILKQYVESLRRFFAHEEGRDEIINDIEDRIAELFSETLKKGSTCITDDEVNTIIASMGRPEEFEAEEANVKSQLGAEESRQQYEQASATQASHRLYRDENKKFLGGVCAGLANYFNIDPIVVRILFVIFCGITLIPYLILWVAVPSSASIQIGTKRRKLFRDPDDKLIGGVCSGLSQYFGIHVWIPRILFLLPFVSFVFRFLDHDWWWGYPHFLSFSFSPGSFFIYIILWLVLPEAKTAADRLEMKGEKVDLNTIRNTVQSDLSGFKDRAQQFGAEMKDRVGEIGKTVGEKGKQFTSEATTVARKSGRGLGDVIIFLVKLFAYFIIGSVLLSIVIGLFILGVVFTGLLPVQSAYVLNDGWEIFLAWATLILFIWVPVIGIITFIIRRLAKIRSNSNIIRSAFIALWLIGLFCFISLIFSVRSDFRYKNNPVEENVALSNAKVDKLEIKIASFNKYYDRDWLRLEPFASFEEDTMFVKNVRVRIIKSPNDSFQVKMVRLSNGSSRQDANSRAADITFSLAQTDTVLMLDKGIPINKTAKFRNQHIVVTIAVPVGKRIKVNERVGWDHNERVSFGNDDWDWWQMDEEEGAQRWRLGVEYIMTASGLERVDKKPDTDHNEGVTEDENGQEVKTKEQIQREIEEKQRELDRLKKESRDSTGKYKYKPAASTTDAGTGDNTGTDATTVQQPQAQKNTKPSNHLVIGDMMMMRFGS